VRGTQSRRISQHVSAITNWVTSRKPFVARACESHQGPEQHVEPDGMHGHDDHDKASSEENFYEHGGLSGLDFSSL